MRIWKFCCSLKLAIVLASLATFLLMGGSLLFPSYPALFGPLDQMPLGRWLSSLAATAPSRSWWFYPFLGTMIALLLNTFCCFCDWLFHLKNRWRKSGEYLIHLGVILLLCAYCWGAVGGWRHLSLQCKVGTLTALPAWPGHYLAVDDFRPVFGANGPPTDMISKVRLLAGDHQLAAGEVRINHPLLRDGLVVTPVSFGNSADGFRFAIAGHQIPLRSGDSYQDPQGRKLEVLRFLPDVRRDSQGQLSYRTDRLGSPAMEIRLSAPGSGNWRGWYFLTQPPPAPLRALGLQPIEPLYTSYSSLTVTYDPGAKLAALGGILAAIGALMALFSFYRKRQRQDRPEL